jgi:hypothetical protein
VLSKFYALCIVLVAATQCAAAASSAPAGTPFTVTASSGPAAGAHIIATVTRTIANRSITLPAALVPALKNGDSVDIDFPDYRRPPGTVNFHVNGAFITAVAPQHWLFEHSTAADQLFRNPHDRRHASIVTGTVHFTYGTRDRRGIPIFFIVPEDAKTRGVDGVRDYVNAHPTDFIDMAQSTNAAVDRYSFLSDFLGSLGSGSIDPATSRQRIESVAQSFGVAPATIDACYATGATTSDVQSCIQQSINSVVYQTNFNAPTQAQFLGGLAAAANPATYAPYIASLLTVWRLFVHTGHQEYEYLPATVSLADPTTAHRDELLMALKVPTIRPPAAVSDVLFFTIGDPQGVEYPPAVVDDAPAAGVCARTDRFPVPLHLDHTSRYVHDAALVVTPDGGAPFRVALDPRSLAAPSIDRSRLPMNPSGGYSVSLSAGFGFDAVGTPAEAPVRVAIPSGDGWAISALPHRTEQAGGSLDLIASSPSAPCLSRAEVQIGNAPPVSLTATPLDARRVELRGSLAGVPAGPARLRFFEDDPSAARIHESTRELTIAAPRAVVDPKSAIASLGDQFVHLTGSGFEQIGRLVVGDNSYTKVGRAESSAACFIGPPLGAALVSGQSTPAELFAPDGSDAQVFPLTVATARPRLGPVTIAPQPAEPSLSTTPISVLLETASGALPRQIGVRLRQRIAGGDDPCAPAEGDPTAIALPSDDVHVRSSTALTVTFSADVLHDRAFGTLELQLVDAATSVTGNWVAIPATFVRAPGVTQIACSADAAAPCRLYGTGLAAIEAVSDGTDAFAAPGLACPPTDKGLACVYVPHAGHYRLRLVDGGTLEDLPDTLVTVSK